MLVDPKSEAGPVGPSPSPGEPHGDAAPARAARPGAAVTLLVVAIALAAGGYRLLVGPFGGSAAALSLAANLSASSCRAVSTA